MHATAARAQRTLAYVVWLRGRRWGVGSGVGLGAGMELSANASRLELVGNGEMLGSVRARGILARERVGLHSRHGVAM